uniref:Uncharacterized protein n=1 Tax=Ditylenchus dipsaci TaxID=166011 RepID=A0A915CPA3_9BILA
MAQQDEEIQLYVPFCNVGNFTASTTLTNKRSPQLDYEKFFCYERLYFKNAVDLNTKPEAVIELANDQLALAGIPTLAKNIPDLTNFFCCCLASLNLTTTNSNNIVACNSGKDVQRFKEQSLLLNPSILDDTVEHQQLCEDNSHTLKKPKIQEMGLGLNIPAMCYFKCQWTNLDCTLMMSKAISTMCKMIKKAHMEFSQQYAKLLCGDLVNTPKDALVDFSINRLKAVCPRNPQIFCVAV